MFHICSMTKGLVTSALGVIVDEGKLSWDTPAHRVLPEYSPNSRKLQKCATLTAFLSIRSGIESYNIWIQSENHIIFPKSESVKIINYPQSAADIRFQFSLPQLRQRNNFSHRRASRGRLGLNISFQILSDAGTTPYRRIRNAEILAASLRPIQCSMMALRST